MVPGSTFRYGSNFSRLTVKPRLSRRHPMDADASPLPSDETTPPVTNINFFSIPFPKHCRGGLLPPAISNFDTVGGHRPPLQWTLITSTRHRLAQFVPFAAEFV